jgi:hypothetical protein
MLLCYRLETGQGHDPAPQYDTWISKPQPVALVSFAQQSSLELATSPAHVAIVWSGSHRGAILFCLIAADCHPLPKIPAKPPFGQKGR